MQYSDELKDALLRRMLPPNNDPECGKGHIDAYDHCSRICRHANAEDEWYMIPRGKCSHCIVFCKYKIQIGRCGQKPGHI